MAKINLAELELSDPGGYRVQQLPLEMIVDNDQNFYSMDNIEGLAENIRLFGVREPVLVVRMDMLYRLISGHRRVAACRQLKMESVPARVLEDMDDATELVSLITANSTARQLTPAEKTRQEDKLRSALQAMKAAGKIVPRNLGEYLAGQLGTSRNEVSRMHSINTGLGVEGWVLFDAGDLTAQKAYELSRLPKEEQVRYLYAPVEEIKAASAPEPIREPEPEPERPTLELLPPEPAPEPEPEPPTQKDAIASLQKIVSGDFSDLHDPKADFRAALDFARAVVHRWAPDACSGITRHEAIEHLRDERGDTGSWSGTETDYTALCKSKPVRLDSFGATVSWTELWDALAIAALERVAKKTREPAGDLWHTEPPEKNGEYIGMYRRPSGETTCSTFEWRGQWRKYGQPVGDVYEILQWTEVPK